MDKKIIIAITSTVAVIALVVLVWGLIGGAQAQNPGITCDTGLGENLCWKWHKNLFGKAEDIISDAGDSFKKLIE